VKEQIHIRYQLLTRDNMQTRTIIALVIVNLTTIGSRARRHLNQSRKTNTWPNKETKTSNNKVGKYMFIHFWGRGVDFAYGGQNYSGKTQLIMLYLGWISKSYIQIISITRDIFVPGNVSF